METWFKIPSKLIVLWVFYQLWGLLGFINVVEVSTTYSSHSISFSLSSPGLNKLTPAIEPIDTFFHGPNCTDARTDRQTLLAAQPTKTGRKETLYTNSLGRSIWVTGLTGWASLPTILEDPDEKKFPRFGKEDLAVFFRLLLFLAELAWKTVLLVRNISRKRRRRRNKSFSFLLKAPTV